MQSPSFPSIDPLADYLEPQFGDAYEAWTPELRSAVKNYLLHEISDDQCAALIRELFDDAPDGPRENQVEFIMSRSQPFDVVDASHRAALRAIPNLQELIRVLLQQGIVNGYEEVNDWLTYHATYEERVVLYRHFDPSVVIPPQDGDWWFFEFANWLCDYAHSLEAVAQAWETVVKSERQDRKTPLDVYTIRVWAREHGRNIGNRGRLPDRVIREYLAEQQD